jgi:DNA polymerase-3 subunit delta
MSKTNQRVYLFLGPELGEKSLRLRELRSALNKEFGEEVEVHRFYPFETLNGEIIENLSTDSLFASHRLVVLSQAEDLNANQVDMLIAYLKSPSPSATLVIISAQTYLFPKLTSLVPKENTQIFWELFENQKGEFLRNLFAKSNFAITGEAVEILLNLVENNTQQLRTTATQLMQFASSLHENIVTDEMVERYIKHTKIESVFSLFEQIAIGTFSRALAILHTLINSKESEPIALISGLTWQFRRLISLQETYEQTQAWQTAFLEAQVGGKKAAIKRQKDQTLYKSANSRYPLKVSRKIVSRLGEYDIKVREMASDFHLLLLELLLDSIMNKEGNQMNQYKGLSFSTDLKF